MKEEMQSSHPMIPNELATQAGLIPVRVGPVRFAIGSPNGLTSNSWRIWVTKHGDVYIACRDNFTEAKVSLHASGRWRVGFTTEALRENPNLISGQQNRAWDVWDEPPATLPNTVTAFHLLFPSSELVVRPEQRQSKLWANVVFIEAMSSGKLTVLTLFVTMGNIILTHESEPSFCLASLDIGGNRFAQLVAHGDPELDIADLIEHNVADACKRAKSANIEIPKEAYGYFLGQRSDGSRFIFGAKINRPRRLEK
jgi:hypothetical protein